MDAQHDFVIVGGGLSGLVVASRLTEDPNVSVVVVEAGEDHTADARIRTPASWISVLGQDDFDWDYTTVPQVSMLTRRKRNCRADELNRMHLGARSSIYPRESYSGDPVPSTARHLLPTPRRPLTLGLASVVPVGIGKP